METKKAECLGISAPDCCPFNHGCIALGYIGDCASYKPDLFREKLSGAMQTLFRKTKGGKLFARSVFEVAARVLEIELGGITRQIFEKLKGAMDERIKTGEKGLFAKRVVEIYYEVCGQKAINGAWLTAAKEDVFDDIFRDPAEDEEIWGN